MSDSFRDDYLIEMLRKPAEIFVGIMPIKRVLYTNRLALRRCCKIDTVELRQLMIKNRSYLSKWLHPQPEIIRLETLMSLITEEHKLARKGERLDLGLFDTLNNTLIGRVALHTVDYGIQRSSYVSYWIDEELAGNGYMTEALATLVSFAFEEAYLHRINAKIAVENTASIALVKKLGFTQEGMEREGLFINGKWQDALLFGLLEKDYDNLADDWMKKGWLGQ